MLDVLAMLHKRQRLLKRRARQAEHQFRKQLEHWLLKDPEALKKIRGNRSQQTAAEAAKTSQSIISEMERGRIDRISEEVLQRVLLVYTSWSEEN